MIRPFHFLLLAILSATSPCPCPAAEVVLRGLAQTSSSTARGYVKTQIEYVEKNGATTARADDAAFFLQRALLKHGFPKAGVEWSIEGDTVVLDVSEGSQATLQTINVRGNRALEDDGIRELLTRQTRDELLIGKSTPVPFVVDDILSGVKGLTSLYQMLGYRDADVSLAQSPPTAPEIDVIIEEGSLYLVGNVTLPDAPDPGFGEDYQSLEQASRDKPFTSDTAAALASQVEEAAKHRGYYDVVASATATTFRKEGDRTFVDLSVAAEFGTRYLISQIEVSGNQKVRDVFFERKFAKLEGAPYDPDAVSRLSGELLRTGAFARASSTVDPHDDGTIGIEIQVEETKTVRFGPYFGYGTYEGPIVGVTYQDTNLFGLARRLGIDAEYTVRGLRGEVLCSYDRFLGSEWALSLSLFSQVEENEGYTKLENGMLAEFRRSLAEEHTVTAFASTSFTDITDFDIERRFLGAENYVTSSLGIRYDYGLGPDSVSDHVGFEFGSFAAIGFSDTPFFRSSARAAYHWLITPDTKLSFVGRSSVIVPLGSDQIPIDLRAFNGGARTVRSFEERALGPRDSGNYPIGGEFSSSFTAQYEFPIPAAPSSIRGAVFADAGNVIFDIGDIGFVDMRYAAGVGLRFRTPIGPLRIDYGYNLNRAEDERSGALHVGFGYAF